PIIAGGAAVRLTPKLGPLEPLATLGFGRVLYHAPLTVHVEARAGSDDWSDESDLWGLIESALTRRGRQPAEILAGQAEDRAAGIDELTLVGPADMGEPGQILITCYVE